MKYLITGATGNLGEKVTRWLRTMTPENNIRVGIHNLKKAVNCNNKLNTFG